VALCGLKLANPGLCNEAVKKQLAKTDIVKSSEKYTLRGEITTKG
jgi:hypothetical protein